jgi:hypothetical protein
MEIRLDHKKRKKKYHIKHLHELKYKIYYISIQINPI